MTTPEERLQKSIAEYRAAVNSIKWATANRAAEVVHLRILVGKYPEHARAFLAENARPAPQAGDGAAAAPDGESVRPERRHLGRGPGRRRAQ